MKIKVNQMYMTSFGHIVPRSRFGEQKPKPYAIIEVVETQDGIYTVKHKTMTQAEIKQALNIEKKEKVEII